MENVLLIPHLIQRRLARGNHPLPESFTAALMHRQALRLNQSERDIGPGEDNSNLCTKDVVGNRLEVRGFRITYLSHAGGVDWNCYFLLKSIYWVAICSFPLLHP